MSRTLIVAVLLLGVALPCRGPAQAVEEQVWIDLYGPPDGFVQKIPIAVVEVQGASGAGKPHYHDLAIVVDLSVSTRLPSGIDVNENGHLGRSAPEVREDYWGSAAPELLCDDAGDTIAAAELVAIRRLLSLLDPKLTRVTLIAFGDRGHVEASLGDSREQVLAAVDALDGKHGWYGGTNYADALRTAVRALNAVPTPGGRAREQSLLFLSDGYPTMPLPEPLPAREAVAAARETAAADVLVHSFALGPEAVRGRDILDLMSNLSGGSTTEIERPGDILFHLPAVDLSQIADVRMRNETSGEAGRAVRLLADGSFSGFVPLVRGANRIRVTATGVEGGVTTLVRTVAFEPVDEPTQEVQIEIDRLRELMKARTVEVEFAEEMRRVREQRREERRKRLKVTPE